MKDLKMNAIANIASTIITTQGAKVKKVSAPIVKPTLTALEIVDIATRSGGYGAVADKADKAIESALESFNKDALSLRSAGIVILDGRKKDKQSQMIRTAFLDGAVASGLASKTAQNYWELFYQVNTTGKEIKTFKPKSAKGEKGEKVQSLSDVLAKVYNHADFETLSESTQMEITEALSESGYLDAMDMPEATT